MITAVSETSARIDAAREFNDLPVDRVSEISAALNGLLADVFALYLKTKNFRWHMSGPHFRDYHLLLDEQSVQILKLADPLAERVRKLGGTTLRSIGHIARLQSIIDSEAEDTYPQVMLSELREDNLRFESAMRRAHKMCDDSRDIATTSLLETWIDEAEGRSWFLYETRIIRRE
ncbi:DNA starvation/stationary phase protection protein [Bradyrhizobium sp. ARR65]|uniref:Dps family protein n=1 Tax=Bradyrhizobium sp. ARR65 TaxID=1040989 RepID=UPI000467AB24|nr:DNA starvation/stationary phase protection protein [Bradyrhizobium sp. ARR65]